MEAERGAAQSSEGAQADEEYYRELLARVDNAIVETRQESSGPVEDCARDCAARTVSGCLIIAAVFTECLVSLKQMAQGR